MNQTSLADASKTYRTKHKRCVYCELFYWPDDEYYGMCMVSDHIKDPYHRPYFCKAYRVKEGI